MHWTPIFKVRNLIPSSYYGHTEEGINVSRRLNYLKKLHYTEFSAMYFSC